MNVLIITYARFPEGDAEAVRLHTIGKMLREIGYTVKYIGMGYSQYKQKCAFDEFEYISLRKQARNRIYRFYQYLDYTKRLKKYLLNYLINNKVDTILFADLPPLAIYMLKNLSKKHNITLVADSVEWYSPQQFKLGIFSPSMIFKNIENRLLIDKSIKVIAISRYLYTYFENKGCTCIRIPVILDVQNIRKEKVINKEKLTILYAGSPGKKDFIEEMLKGILLLDKEDFKNLNFIVAGVREEDIEEFFNKEDMKKLNECVKFLGKVERKVVFENLIQADFTVLLRSDNQRYAKAGFPTKVVESLATSTPIILNLTSDLEEYIKDGKEALIVENCCCDAFSLALRKALQLSLQEREQMKKDARLCAEKNFDYRLYKNKYEEWSLMRR